MKISNKTEKELRKFYMFLENKYNIKCRNTLEVLNEYKKDKGYE